jgi:AraC-like DNA-binding protein
MLFLTEFHKVKPIDISELHLLRFNRSFYCIVDHDYEISCKGLLFFGASTVPEIRLTPDVIQKFELLWSAFEMEMQEQDNLQVEMLQMMLKRFIILCTRIYKAQSDYHTMQQADQDIIREFNYLVEKHYRSLHKVSDYAALLHKSPKTLSNLFANRAQTPLQLIQNRKLLEAKRMLHYSSESVKEIAFELGFQETTTFSRFFKAQTGISPKTYREKSKSGKTVNS